MKLGLTMVTNLIIGNRARRITVILILSTAALVLSRSQPDQGSQDIKLTDVDLRALDLIASPARSSAALPGKSETCFGAQAEEIPAAEAAKVSAVHLVIAAAVPGVVPNFLSNLPGVSGFVVANSNAGAGNRIVTARHILLHPALISGESRIHVLDTRGVYIGVARVVAIGKEIRPGEGDAAVLEISAWASGGQEAFARIPGLTFANIGLGGGFRGVAGIPTGLFLGGSGAALVDASSGLALGILTGALPADTTVNVTTGNIRRMWSEGPSPLPVSNYRLRAISGYWAETLPLDLFPALGIPIPTQEPLGDKVFRPLGGFIASFSEAACTVSLVTTSSFVPWKSMKISLDLAVDIPSLADLIRHLKH